MGFPPRLALGQAMGDTNRDCILGLLAVLNTRSEDTLEHTEMRDGLWTARDDWPGCRRSRTCF